ncbi:MAG: type II toxin-antitoxin system RelE/ParE family toxin [Kineosporiaceae bacterium]|nr:type II toxin-antitoxin system RelE/ParE family toxin [Aeromicrobium sp.]
MRRLETTAEFDTTLKKLDKPVRQRIAKAIDDLGELEDPRSRGRGLTGNLSGYWRHRLGDYRLLAAMHDDRLVIIAVGVGHRSAVYDN